MLDTRTDGEWEGTNNRGNKRAGRVPNAKHLEWLRFVATDDNRKFLPADEHAGDSRRGRHHARKPIITYCQGGIRAAHAAFVLDLLGYEDVRVYDGSCASGRTATTRRS